MDTEAEPIVRRGRPLVRGAGVLVAAALAAAPAVAGNRTYNYSSHPGAPAPIFASMPKHIRLGDTVLVDDHTCTRGTIKQVTGGSGSRGVPRTKECVPRP